MVLYRFLYKFGFQNILQGQECPILSESNIHILSITATRANEDSIYNNENDEEVKKHWGRVYGTRTFIQEHYGLLYRRISSFQY